MQQTPVVRVEPVWCSWMRQWPTPGHLADSTPEQVLRAWGRLGYPRRALWLRQTAITIRDKHHGRVPSDATALRALPGIGEYTASAVGAFAFGQPVAVLDTNVRRVLGRLLHDRALPPPHITSGERNQAVAALPVAPGDSVRWNTALMELGALVCTATSPDCGRCPVKQLCSWRAAGYPPDAYAAQRRRQAWNGTDRQDRGRVMAALRDAPGPLTASDLPPNSQGDQRARVLDSLLADSLIESLPNDPPTFRLPVA